MAKNLVTLTSITLSLLATGIMAPTAPLDAAPVRTAREACNQVKSRVSAVRHFAASTVASCDTLGAEDSPKGFYVLALHSNRRCDGICSSNMGWFAIQKRSGRIFEWDVAEMRLGRPITADR